MQINLSIAAKLKLRTEKKQFSLRNKICKHTQKFVDTKLRFETGEKNFSDASTIPRNEMCVFCSLFVDIKLEILNWIRCDSEIMPSSCSISFLFCGFEKNLEHNFCLYFSHTRAQWYCVCLCLLSSSS